jgi:diketogulonate reductase-like aldo/keto reductase
MNAPTVGGETCPPRPDLQNAQIFDIALSADDMAELDELDQTGGTARALEANWWS